MATRQNQFSFAEYLCRMQSNLHRCPYFPYLLLLSLAAAAADRTLVHTKRRAFYRNWKLPRTFVSVKKKNSASQKESEGDKEAKGSSKRLPWLHARPTAAASFISATHPKIFLRPSARRRFFAFSVERFATRLTRFRTLRDVSCCAAPLYTPLQQRDFIFRRR